MADGTDGNGRRRQPGLLPAGRTPGRCAIASAPDTRDSHRRAPCPLTDPVQEDRTCQCAREHPIRKSSLERLLSPQPIRFAEAIVVADAATSVLAIVALLGGMVYGWHWLDPAIGILGSVLVARWAWGLIHDTARVLLDREMDHPLVDQVRRELLTNAA